jgi:hypothetical protein
LDFNPEIFGSALHPGPGQLVETFVINTAYVGYLTKLKGTTFSRGFGLSLLFSRLLGRGFSLFFGWRFCWLFGRGFGLFFRRSLGGGLGFLGWLCCLPTATSGD